MGETGAGPAAAMTLQLAGPVRLIAADGRDATPRAAKARGILALLGTARDLRLTRAVLTDKLWSDRGAEQGAASLRQALHAIRTAAGHEILTSGAGWVGLDPDLVRVDLAANRSAGELSEFAADLDIRDPEFDDWLRDRRMHFEAEWRAESAEAPEVAQPPVASAAPVSPVPSTPTIMKDPRGLPPWCIVVGHCAATGEAMRLRGEIMLHDVASKVAQLTGLPVNDDSAPVLLPGQRRLAGAHPLTISCRVVETPDRFLMQPALSDGTTGEALWSQTFWGYPDHLSAVMDDAVEGLTLSTLATLSDPRRYDVRNLPPLNEIFGLAPDQLEKADARLAQAGEEDVPRAQHLALRAYIRHTQLLERLAPDADERLEEAARLASEALVLAPVAPLPLSVASLITGLRGNAEAALDLAQRAERSAPRDPFVLHCLSTAWSFAGKADKANTTALTATESRLTELAPHIHHLRMAYAALGVGDRTAALLNARRAVAHAPEFRAALRVRAALEFEAGHEVEAAKALADLKRAEPDFSLDLMRSDAYPVDSLRRAGLLNVAKSGLL